MFYFKVKRDSKLFEKLTKANEMQKKWFANRKDIYKTVGLPVVEAIFIFCRLTLVTLVVRYRRHNKHLFGII